MIIPQTPNKIKEWAYAGLGIIFISASIAHSNSGDPMNAVVTPLVILAVLAVSYIYKGKVTIKNN